MYGPEMEGIYKIAELSKSSLVDKTMESSELCKAIPWDLFIDETMSSTSSSLIDEIEYCDLQNDEQIIQSPNSLVYQLSLQTGSREMSAMEKPLQFQDDVPLRSRNKRGFATHPRSIAERVRRLRISQAMRRLQDFFPNMDKQTSTADMLDLVVDYIKELQKEVETLSDWHAKCTCPHKQKL